jgi:hypothetical protein
MFWHNEEFAVGLGRDIALDGVICVVDAVFGRQVRGYSSLTKVEVSQLRFLSKWKKTRQQTQSERASGEWPIQV